MAPLKQVFAWLLAFLFLLPPLHATSSAPTCSSTNVVPGSCTAAGPEEESPVPFTGLPGTASERSFFAIKPDGVQRGLVGEVLTRFERKGWKLVALKLVVPSRTLVENHYEEHMGKPFFENLVTYFCSGPVVAMVWEGNNTIAGGRKMLGATNPLDAEIGTIRGDFCTSAGRNLVHASDSPQSALREIGLWFREEETTHWTRSNDPWIVKGN
ncbi:unnamed protein product [Choristocarpus tenellus]